MAEEDQNQQSKSKWIPLGDIVAYLVFIAIGATTIVVLHEFVGVRLWLSVVIGIPGGLLLFLGGAWLVSSLLSERPPKRRRRSKKTNR